MSDAGLGQPRLYRVRVFAPDGEVHAGRDYRVALDLTPGPALRLAKAELDSLLHALAAADDPAADVTRYHLVVIEIDTGEQFDWPAR